MQVKRSPSLDSRAIRQAERQLHRAIARSRALLNSRASPILLGPRPKLGKTIDWRAVRFPLPKKSSASVQAIKSGNAASRRHESAIASRRRP